MAEVLSRGKTRSWSFSPWFNFSTIVYQSFYLFMTLTVLAFVIRFVVDQEHSCSHHIRCLIHWLVSHMHIHIIIFRNLLRTRWWFFLFWSLRGHLLPLFLSYMLTEGCFFIADLHRLGQSLPGQVWLSTSHQGSQPGCHRWSLAGTDHPDHR